MRAINCPCGHYIEAADDEELFRLARAHVDRDHPEMQRTDEQIWDRHSQRRLRQVTVSEQSDPG